MPFMNCWFRSVSLTSEGTYQSQSGEVMLNWKTLVRDPLCDLKKKQREKISFISLLDSAKGHWNAFAKKQTNKGIVYVVLWMANANQQWFL